MRFFVFYFIIILFSFCVSNEDKSPSSYFLNLSKSIEESPYDVDLLLERVDYNTRRDHLESALFDLKQCLLIDSLNADYHFKIADVYFTISKKNNLKSTYPDLARFHLERSLKIDNQHYRSYSLLGELLLAYGDYKGSLDNFISSLEINYNQANTHTLMGFTFKQLGSEKEAINSFRNAISINPDYKEAYVQLGQMYHSKNDSLALIYYDKALSIDSNDELVIYNKAVFYQNKLDWNNALEMYAELHSINPFHASGHYNLGFINMELNLFDIATNNFSDAIYSDPNFFEAYYSRGICFENLGNIAQAESDYRRAIEINSEYLFAIEALDQLLYKNKKYK